MRKLISIILIMLLIFSSIVTTLSLAYEEVNDVKEEIKNNDENINSNNTINNNKENNTSSNTNISSDSTINNTNNEINTSTNTSNITENKAIDEQQDKEQKTDSSIANEEESNIQLNSLETERSVALEDGTYYIKSKLNENMVFDVADNSKNNYAKIQLWEKSAESTDNQKFEISNIGNGYYKIIAKHSKKSLDIPGASNVNCTKIQQYDSNGTDAQQWIIKDAGDGYYNIISKCNGLYLDVYGAMANNGTQMQIYEGNGSNAQKFKLEKIETGIIGKQTIKDGTYYIKSKLNTNMVFDVVNNSKENYAKIQLWEKSVESTNNQKFNIKYIGNGYYSIEAKHSNKSLDIPGAGKNNGTKVQQYDSNGTDAQQWIIKDAGNGDYCIISKCNGLYLDVAGANAQNGVQMQVYEGNETDAQKFKFEKIEEIVGEKTIEDGNYKIKVASNKKMTLDVDNMSRNNGANVQLWEESDLIRKNQRYKIKYIGDGCYKIEAIHSGKVLDVTGESMVSGANVQQYEDNGTDAQRWIIKDNKDGTYSIISKANNLYINVQDNKIANGGNIQVSNENGSDSQKFVFEKIKPEESKQTIANGVYKITTGINSGKVLDVANGSYDNQANVQIWDNGGSQQQKFEITYKEDGYYEIKNTNSGKVLDVAGGSSQNCTNVQQYISNNTDYQKWIIKDAGDGYFYIISKGAEAYLNIAGASSSNGTNVQIYDGNGTFGQKFKFQQIQIVNNNLNNIVTSINPTKVIDLDLNTNNLQIWELNKTSENQRFEFTYIKDGYYKIINKATSKALTAEGKNVNFCDYSDLESQKWKIETAINGYFYIKSKSTGLYLDIVGAGTTDGTKVHLYEKNSSKAQMFKFVENKNNATKDFSEIDESKYPGYKEYLEKLQAQHPNWIIKIKYTGLDWYTVLDNEDMLVNGQPKSLTQLKNEWKVGDTEYGTGWYRASRGAIAYMMDPRNSLDDGYVFQFQELASSAGKYSDISKMISGTFLTKYSEYNEENIINAILDASKTYNISPFHITSRILQESGIDGGTLNGYIYNRREIYNLFNIGATGASDEEIIRNGAEYAYKQHWFTPQMCINGSVSFLKKGYFINGQSTLYFQKYNVVNMKQLYNNQYMQNIRAANDEGKRISDEYKASGLINSQFEFTIPVYENMPSTPCASPAR